MSAREARNINIVNSMIDDIDIFTEGEIILSLHATVNSDYLYYLRDDYTGEIIFEGTLCEIHEYLIEKYRDLID